MFYECLKKNERFAHSLFLNERCEQIAQVAHSLIFWQKTSNSLRKPMSEFPALGKYDQKGWGGKKMEIYEHNLFKN